MIGLFILESVVFSTLLYYYLHIKTKISLKFLFIDNIGVIAVSALLSWWMLRVLPTGWGWSVFLMLPVIVAGFAFGFTMIRFWRTPRRKVSARPGEIVSPADGNVIYVTRVEAGEIPMSVKGNRISKLEELTKTDLLDKPCWLVGINMTPFDVHKNCAPIDGRVLLNQHFDGEFLSLKEGRALTENERNTYVIANSELKVGIVQIASRLVRRIDSYVKEEDSVKQGDWLGMIRFGSQVDVILPLEYNINVRLKQQIYAGTTILATPSKKKAIYESTDRHRASGPRASV